MTTSLLRPEAFALLGERVLLKPDKPVTQIGRIILPPSAQKHAEWARVEKMGPGMLTKSGGRWPMPDIAVGDRVCYDPRVHDYCPKFKIEGEEYIVVYPDRILAVEEPSSAAAE